MREKFQSPGSSPNWRQALVIMAFLQAVLSFAIRALPVIGPEVTAAAGVAPHDIGILVGATGMGTMLFLLGGSPAITYYGPVRILQIGAVAAMFGAFLGLMASWWALVLAAFLFGLGYGPSPPAASELLTRTCPPNHRSLIMSVKQAAVPLGGTLAGVMLPAIAVLAGWREALFVTALICLAGALVVQPWREQLDVDPNEAIRPTIGTLFSKANFALPFVVLRKIPGMLPLTLAIACFSCVQGCILAFFVTQLTDGLGFSLAVSGAAFSAMQISGTFSRVLMGWIADRLGSAKTLLLLAMASTLMTLVLSIMEENFSTWLIILIGFMAGSTSVSWNGVFLAEVARIAPTGRVGDATAGSTFFLFIAYALGPLLFAFGVPLVGGYGPCFLIVALVQVLAIPALLRCIRLNP